MGSSLMPKLDELVLCILVKASCSILWMLADLPNESWKVSRPFCPVTMISWCSNAPSAGCLACNMLARMGLKPIGIKLLGEGGSPPFLVAILGAFFRVNGDFGSFSSIYYYYFCCAAPKLL